MPFVPDLPPLLPAFCVPGALPPMIVQWEANASPQGVPYFYCKATGESRWERPSGPQDLVLEASAPASAAPAAPAAAVAGPTGPPSAGAIRASLGEPESWETIGKSGWLRVETENGFKYFFHKKKKTTSWTCPEEIAKEVAELDGVLGIAPELEPAAKGQGPEPKAAAEGAAPAAGEAAEAGAKTGGAANDASAEQAEKPRLGKAERVEKKEEEQKISKEKQILLNFKQMLIEKHVKPFDKYEKWLPKLIADKRFTAVRQAERKALFTAYAKRIDSDRAKQDAEKKKSGREGFRELLAKAEQLGLLDRPGAEACRQMEKKFGEEARWKGTSKKERDRIIMEAAEDRAKKLQKIKDQARAGFHALVVEKLKGLGGDPPAWLKIEKSLRKDPRWEAMECTSERERVYGQVAKEIFAARREKKKRQQTELDEVEQIRKKRRMTAAEEALMNLLAERVKAPYATTWEDVVEALGEAPELRECRLEPEEQERIFADYRLNVTDQRCQEFANYLATLPADVVGPEMEFDEVLETGLDMSAAKAFVGMPEDRLRDAWAEWRGHAHERAVQECRQWLRSCGLLHGCEGLAPGSPPFEHLLQKLSRADVRFRRVGAKPEEQRQLVEQRLAELSASKEHRGDSGPSMDVDGEDQGT